MSNPEYGKRIITQTIYDGKISNENEELQSDVFTDKDSLFKDLLNAMSVATTGKSKKITIELCVDKQNRWRLRSRWVV